MTKFKVYTEFTPSEIDEGYNSMLEELHCLKKDHPIVKNFNHAWSDFKDGLFSYDGATFVKERYNYSLFEVAAFIHDWRNGNGYVGKEIDQELFDTMVTLRYPPQMIAWRWIWCRLTFVNKIRHKLLREYKKELPDNLYLLNNFKNKIS